jgi:chemotaxis protein CheX
MSVDAGLEPDVITAAKVDALAADVWDSLGLGDAGPVPGAAEDDRLVTASVSVAGRWTGHVTVSCGTDTGRALAAAMLGLDGSNIEDADMADAIGELANMVGGSLKGLLPPPSTLSLPHVITGPGATHHFPHARPVCRSRITAVHGPVTITVWHSTAERIHR